MKLLLIPVILVTGFLSGAWHAFVASKLYSWFVVPLGAPPLSWWHIWGLIMVIGVVAAPYTVNNYKPREDDDHNINYFARTLVVFLASAIALLVGWIVKGQI